MGFRGTLLLLLLLGGLGVALWLSADGKTDAGAALTESVLDGRSIVDARRIVVRQDQTAVPIEFERAGEWRVVEPVRDLASVALLEQMRIAFDPAQLVVAFEAAEVDGKVLAETGLDEPRSWLRVEWPDGKVVELAIGLPGPYGQDLFARRTEPSASARIYRVQTSLRNALQFTSADAREKLVFRTDPGLVRSVRLTRRAADGPTDVLGLERRSGAWVMTEPAGLRIDQVQTAGFVQALLGLRIEEFLKGRPAPGLAPIDPDAPPDVVIEVEGGPTPERVSLYFAPDRVMLVGHNDARELWFSCAVRGYEQIVELPVRSLRAFWILSFAVDEARVVRVVPPGGGDTLELERREAAQFRMVRPIARDTDPTAVSELLQALRSLAVVDFVADGATDFARWGLDDRALVVEVEARRGRPERLLVGADAGPETTWLRRADEPHVVSIPRAVAERFRRPWYGYVDRRLLRIADGAQVRRIVRTAADGSAVEFERGGDGQWRRGGAGEALPLVADVFDLLRDLSAVDVVPESTAAESRGTLKLLAASGQVVGALELGVDAGGRGLCATGDAPGLRFVLSARDTRDVLELR